MTTHIAQATPPPSFSGRMSDRAFRELDPADVAAADAFTVYAGMTDYEGEGREEGFLRCKSCDQAILRLSYWSSPNYRHFHCYTGQQIQEAIRRHAFQAHRADFPTIRAMLGTS